MKLQDFIQQSLVEIVEGVKAAQKAVEDSNTEELVSAVSPTNRKNGIVQKVLTPVSFDVAVTASETNGSGGGGEIKVIGVFKAGGDTKAISSETFSSRIQFLVDVQLPLDATVKDDPLEYPPAPDKC